MLSFQEVMELPEDVLHEMLQAEGAVIADAQRKKIQELDLVDSGQLRDSIAIDEKMKGDVRLGGTIRYINVYPKGTRKKKDDSAQTATRKFKKRRKGKTESVREVTNSEVAFVNEFGAPGRNIPATQWMLVANEEAADSAVDAAEKVYDNFLKSKNL